MVRAAGAVDALEARAARNDAALGAVAREPLLVFFFHNLDMSNGAMSSREGVLARASARSPPAGAAPGASASSASSATRMLPARRARLHPTRPHSREHTNLCESAHLSRRVRINYPSVRNGHSPKKSKRFSESDRFAITYRGFNDKISVRSCSVRAAQSASVKVGSQFREKVSFFAISSRQTNTWRLRAARRCTAAAATAARRRDSQART